MASRRCRIHYRRILRDGDRFPAQSLSDRITAALNKGLPDGTTVRGRPENRVCVVPNQDARRALNNFYIGEDHVFGTVCTFTPGEMQALLKLVGDAEQPEQEALAAALEAWDIAEKKAPDGHEYLHGMAYWLAIGDHFYVIQHAALQSKAMEEYLTWLLRDKAGVIGGNNMVQLQVVFDREQLGEDDLSAIHIGGIVPDTMHAPDMVDVPDVPQMVDVEELETIGDKVKATFGRARKIIDDLLGEVEAARIIQSMPPEAMLEVSVSIGYKATKRKLRRAFMGELATGLRNIADGEIKVIGRNGQAKGDDARLSMDMNVKKVSENSSLLDLQNVYDQMMEVHRRFLHDDKLEGEG
ncbi:MAG TPA: hypothetical protein VJ750_09640 [Rhizomicrobium sp.]|nr:hypothetical protein [Rhizomicrobium sp.]